MLRFPILLNNVQILRQHIEFVLAFACDDRVPLENFLFDESVFSVVLRLRLQSFDANVRSRFENLLLLWVRFHILKVLWLANFFVLFHFLILSVQFSNKLVKLSQIFFLLLI